MIGNIVRFDDGFISGHKYIRLCWIILFMSVVMLAAVGVNATTYFVNVGQPDDTGDGLSWPTAMKAIQTAIDSSAAGDTILVKHGIYNTTTDLLLDSDRRITSDDGGNNSWDTAAYAESLCTIDASATGRILTITGSGVTGETCIRGFRITGGRATGESPGATYGGGIYIANGADPVIEYCRITGNTATTSGTGYGGGIACRHAGTEPVLRYNWIDNNKASTSWYGYGGGIYCIQLTACEIDSNTVYNNVASTVRAGFGGGIYCNESTVDVHRNHVLGNVAAGPSAYGGEGGGIYVYRGTVEISGGEISQNHAAEGNNRSGKGGGIFTSGSGSIVIRDHNSFLGNVASTNGPGYGGGIYCGSGSTTIRDIRFCGNKAASDDDAGEGGALFLTLYGGSIFVYDNHFLDNHASVNGLGKGGAISTNTAPEIYRNLIQSNAASDSSEGYGGACYFTNASNLVFTNNTLYHNRNTFGPYGSGIGSGLYHNSGTNLTIVNNIIAGHNEEYSDSLGIYTVPPLAIHHNCFHDNPGGDYNANVTSTDEILADPRFYSPMFPFENGYYLQYDSPCIEAGDPAHSSIIPQGWVVDMGAFEYQGERHWRAVTGTGELLFGGQVKAKVNVTTLGTLSEIDMVVHPWEYHPQAPVSIKRWFEIDHVGDGMAFDLILTYNETELDGQDESNLAMWRYTDTNYWDGPITTNVDVVENIATATGLTEFSDWVLTDAINPTGVGDAPGGFQLFVNYPNPFNPSTTIAYQLAAPSHVDLVIYDPAGRLVKVLVDSRQPEGYQQVRWDGRDQQGSPVASGVYFCRIITAGGVKTTKMVLLK